MAAKKWNRANLIQAFRSLDARDPEGWAESQINEGIPQLHRFAFLKSLWAKVAGSEDKYWVKSVAAKENDLPDEDACAALKRMKKLGVSDNDVLHVVRAARAEQVYFLAQVIDDSASALSGLGYIGDEADVAWGLFTIDSDGKPGQAIDSLHESVEDVGNRD